MSMQEHHQHTRRYGQQSLNIKERAQPSAGYNRIHRQQFQQTTVEEQRQWTWEQSAKENTKEKEEENTKARKARRATKEKVTGATVNINKEITIHSQQKEKERLDKECLSKVNMTKEKESHTASQQDKEKDISFVTSVDNQATQ